MEVELDLHLPLPVLTRREPLRSRNGRMFPHPKTIAGLETWRSVWMQSGRVVVPSPIVLEVYTRCLRPQSHFLSKGGLSVAGKKQPWPGGWDLSNQIKLIEDALKGRDYCFADDADIVAIHTSKRWVRDFTMAGTFVTIRTAQPLD